MGDVKFISDLHLGHKNILRFSGPLRGGTTSEEHDEWIVEQWNSVVNNRDLVWVLGDVAFPGEGNLDILARLKGRKKLVRGNHDTLPTAEYLKYFEDIYGIYKKYGYWITHAPVHPLELRGKKNIHGHVHQHSINDNRYINVCVEENYGIPISLQEIRSKYGYK